MRLCPFIFFSTDPVLKSVLLKCYFPLSNNMVSVLSFVKNTRAYVTHTHRHDITLPCCTGYGTQNISRPHNGLACPPKYRVWTWLSNSWTQKKFPVDSGGEKKTWFISQSLVILSVYWTEECDGKDVSVIRYTVPYLVICGQASVMWEYWRFTDKQNTRK